LTIIYENKVIQYFKHQPSQQEWILLGELFLNESESESTDGLQNQIQTFEKTILTTKELGVEEGVQRNIDIGTYKNRVINHFKMAHNVTKQEWDLVGKIFLITAENGDHQNIVDFDRKLLNQKEFDEAYQHYQEYGGEA